MQLLPQGTQVFFFPDSVSCSRSKSSVKNCSTESLIGWIRFTCNVCKSVLKLQSTTWITDDDREQAHRNAISNRGNTFLISLYLFSGSDKTIFFRNQWVYAKSGAEYIQVCITICLRSAATVFCFFPYKVPVNFRKCFVVIVGLHF